FIAMRDRSAPTLPPYSHPTRRSSDLAQAAVHAIREVDMKTPIIVEGDRWASSFHWRMVNEDFLLEDPADNLIYSAHIYFDKDFRSEEHTSELQSRENLVCRLLLEKKK